MGSYRNIVIMVGMIQQCVAILMCPDLNPCLCSIVSIERKHGVKSGLSIDCSNRYMFNTSILENFPEIQIVTLAMRNISIKKLPLSYFQNLQVEILDLSGSHIDHVKDILDEIEPTLTELKINGVNLDKDALTRLNRFTNLTRLSLSKTNLNIKTMSRGVLRKLTELQFLDLSENNLRNTDTVKIFHGLKNLKELNLMSAMLDIDLEDSLHFLKNMISLETLTLDGNVKSAFTFGSNFKELNLVFLQTLSLKHNHIAKIHNEAFKRTKELKVLDLSFNELPMVPFAVTSQLFNLTHLNVSSNNITHILDNTFKNLTNLKYLNFHNNQLENFPRNAFRGLENLETLDLSNNQLTSGFFWIQGLRPLRSLLSLNISFNKLKYIQNDSFDTTPYLTELDISGNPLKFTDTMFSGIEFSLKNLYMRNLKIKHVPLNSLTTIDQLNVLDLSNNRFEKLNKQFLKGIKARNIYLQNMNISKISSKAFAKLKGPISLFLDNNNIHSLSVVNSSSPCFFNTLSLTNNPIECDCDALYYYTSGRVENVIGSCVDSEFYGVSLHNLSANANFLSELCNSPVLSKGKCISTGQFIVNSAASFKSIVILILFNLILYVVDAISRLHIY